MAVDTPPDPTLLNAARAIALTRVAVGGALVAAPGITGPWMGRRAARTAGARVAVRAFGIRDLMLGGLTLHVLSHPQVGPRWLATCALADVVDGGATWAARRELPATAMPIVAAAAAAAAGQVAIAALLRRDRA